MGQLDSSKWLIFHKIRPNPVTSIEMANNMFIEMLLYNKY